MFTMMIGTTGPDFAPRFYITDEDRRFWNDMIDGWTRNPKEATLFVSQDDVGRKLHDLMLAQVPGEVQTFTLPLTVEVKSLEPVTVKDLRAWLDKALQIGLNATHGTGPVANSMATLCVNLDQIKKEG